MGYDTCWDNLSHIRIKDIKKVREIINNWEDMKIICTLEKEVKDNKTMWFFSLRAKDDGITSCFSHSSIEEMWDFLEELCPYLEDFNVLVWDEYSLYEDGAFYRVINKNGKFDAIALVLKKARNQDEYF